MSWFLFESLWQSYGRFESRCALTSRTSLYSFAYLLGRFAVQRDESSIIQDLILTGMTQYKAGLSGSLVWWINLSFFVNLFSFAAMYVLGHDSVFGTEGANHYFTT